MYELPTTITINNTVHSIRNQGDFRMVLGCFAILQDEEFTQQERVISALMLFYEGIEELEDLEKLGDLEEAVHQMALFFNCGKDDDQGAKSSYKLLDWDKDEMLIISAVNNVAKKEIRLEPYVHWWTFMAYYMAVGESSLSTVVGIRNKIANGKKLENYERDFRRNNPQYFNWDMRNTETREFDKQLRELWNQNSERRCT